MKARQVLFVVFVSMISTIVQIKLTAVKTGPIAPATAISRGAARFANLKHGNKEYFSDDFAIRPSILQAVVHVRAISREEQHDNFNSRLQPGEESRISASGVIISSNGFIITNYHVVKNALSITVSMQNKKLCKAVLVGIDRIHDLAVLKINEQDLSFLSYGNSDMMRVGDWVLAIGYPWQLDETVTAGIISALPREREGVQTGYEVNNYIQTDAAINLGNSGGALINKEGKLIGINAALVSPNEAYTGYGYAIPAATVRNSVDHIITTWKNNKSA
jgi:S1-C subfamily serine protease